jgi:anti-sigma factor RsiW
MNCSVPESKPDWKAYALGELDRGACRLAEEHAARCQACREELATLRLTLDTLSTLREEEVPRRIAFVSDQVFEPRWWQRLFSPGFAAACVVAAAILVHAFAGQGVSEAEVQARIDAALEEVRLQQAQLAALYEYQSKYFRQAYVMNAGLVNQ